MRGIRATSAALAAGVALTATLAVSSVFVGVADVTPVSLLHGGPDSEAALLLAASRLPRTVALLLAGAASAIAGLIMQMLVRNRFVEPGTTGTTEAAALGLLVVTVGAPGLPLTGKMAVAIGFALLGTALFLLLLRRVPVRSVILVPLIGIMLGSVVGAVTTFFAYRLDLLQTLDTWLTGDFSGVLRGRYELLWVAFAATITAWVAADRLTVAGLGRDFTTNLGMHYGRALTFGVAVVATVASVVVVTVGAIPFLGLVVPNIVRLVLGDNARRAIPWVAVAGAAFVLACDLVGRTVRYPYEIPLGVVVGVVGAAVFLYLLLRSSERVH
nr:iron chelate uptake ABC transporter family permease subunit [Micromonospora sp. HNM0581]